MPPHSDVLTKPRLPLPRKRFGQHFLTDPHILEKIVHSLHLSQNDALLEIGAGRGALTRLLHERLPALWAVELDRDLVPHLRAQYPRLTVFATDALQFDYSQWTHLPEVQRFSRKRLIGNLPYNIASPLIFAFAHAIDEWFDLTIMVQKEVAERMASAPHQATYGKLSVNCQFYFSVTKLFDVAPGSFYPPPKVMSSVVRLTPQPIAQRPPELAERLSLIVGTAFGQRRKKLINSLRPLFPAEVLIAQGFADLRAENLSLADYLVLARLPLTRQY